MQSGERKNSMKIKNLIFSFVLIVVSSLVVSCGVKNDPQPPASPDDIGHGRPLYTPQTGEGEGDPEIKPEAPVNSKAKKSKRDQPVNSTNGQNDED